MLTRTCGKCQVILNKENSTRLQWLQPDCDNCTTQEQLYFEKSLLEKYRNPELLESNK